MANEAFPQRMDLHRPYPRASKTHKLDKSRAIFNYRLSRARRTVECAFSLLVQRFRIFDRRINLIPENADRVVKACCVLHNHLRGKKDLCDMNNLLNPDANPYLANNGAILNVRNLHGHHTKVEVNAVKDIFKAYFNSPHGSVPWQDEMIFV